MTLTNNALTLGERFRRAIVLGVSVAACHDRYFGSCPKSV